VCLVHRRAIVSSFVSGLLDGFFGFLAFVFALRFATMGCLLG
jgi:hypothetical protein